MQKKSNPSKHDKYFRTDHLIDGIGARTARGGLVTMAIHGCKFAMTLGVTMILARLLTPGDYGLFGMVTVITNFASLFKDAGLGMVIIQKPEITQGQVSTLFWVNLALSFILMAFVVLIAPLVVWFYGEPRLAGITLMTAIGFIVGGLAVQHQGLLYRQMKFFTLGGINFMSLAFGYSVSITLARYDFHYWALVFGQLAISVTYTMGVWLACGWWPGKPKRSPEVKSMLAFGGGVTGYSTINYLSRNMDSLLIGKVIGAQAVGFYSKATQLLELPLEQFNTPIATVTMPVLSRLANDPQRYRQAYQRIIEKVVMVTMPLIALMIVTSDWMVYLMLGPQWTESVPLFVWMGIAGFSQPVITTISWMMATQGRSRHMFYWSLINAPIFIISIIVGLKWGTIGVAASCSLAKLLLANPITYWFVGRSGPVRTKDFYRLQIPFAFASGIAMLVCYCYKDYADFGNPIVGIASITLLMGSVNLLVLCLLPRGRSALLDIKQFVLLIRPARPGL